MPVHSYSDARRCLFLGRCLLRPYLVGLCELVVLGPTAACAVLPRLSIMSVAGGGGRKELMRVSRIM